MLPDQLGFAIVDEVDSILIDESRNPMIISQPRGDNGALVITVDKVRVVLWCVGVCCVSQTVCVWGGWCGGGVRDGACKSKVEQRSDDEASKGA